MNRIKLLPVVLSFVMCLGCEFGMKDLVDELTQPSKFTVTYDSNGALIGAVPIDNNEYREGAFVTVPDNSGNLEKGSLLYFTGWNTSPDGQGINYTSGDTFIMGKSDVILYANWREGTFYRITYDANGGIGDVPVDNTFYEEGTPVYVKDSNGLTKDLCTFGGWNKRASGLGDNFTAGNFFLMGAGDVILYAKWNTDQTFIVTYEGNGSTGGLVPEDDTHYLPTETVTIKDNIGNLEKTGYIFDGWTDISGATYYQPKATFTMGTANVTLYARWRSYSYTVTFDQQGADTYSNPTSKIVASPETTVVTLPENPGKADYYFSGWWTTADDSGVPFTSSSVVTGDITVFAHWSLIPVYTVTFIANGGSETGSQLVQENKCAQTPEVPVKTGYLFGGWFQDAEFSTPWNFSTTVTGDRTLYARWDNYSYTVTFDQQGATTNSNPTTKTVASPAITVDLMPSNPVKTGYIFGGWYTQSTGGTPFTASTPVTGSITVYARWNSYSYTVTFEQQGATTSSNPLTKTVASPATTVDSLPSNPVKNGYGFGGWYTQSTGGTPFTASTPVTGSITVFARWNHVAKSWHSIACSSDGTKLAAVVYGGYIYTSTDSGATWTERTNRGSSEWWSIASSSDGTRLAVCDLTHIYTSVDSGATWVERYTGAGSSDWRGIICSDSGTVLGVINFGGYIYTSINTGGSWSVRDTAGANYWYSIAGSYDCLKLAAIDMVNGYIYTSGNTGATWTKQTGASAGVKSWWSVTSSSDGTKLAAVVLNDYIYTSTDSGVSWTARSNSGSRYWSFIASSDNGAKLAAVVGGYDGGNPKTGYIYTSIDSGATWVQRTGSGNRNWNSITSSSDGTKLAAVVNEGYIYTSTDSGVTWTESF